MSLVLLPCFLEGELWVNAGKLRKWSKQIDHNLFLLFSFLSPVHNHAHFMYAKITQIIFLIVFMLS